MRVVFLMIGLMVCGGLAGCAQSSSSSDAAAYMNPSIAKKAGLSVPPDEQGFGIDNPGAGG